MRNFSIAFMSLVFLAGCDKLPFSQDKTPPPAAVKTVTSETQPQEDAKINGPLLARINSWQIGLDDFNQEMDALKPVAAQSKTEWNREARLNELNTMVQMQILAQMAAESHYDKLPDTLRSLNQGKTMVLATKMVNEIDKNIMITPLDVQNFYNTNKDKLYTKPEERKVRELAVSSEDEATALSIKILQGEDFAATAQKVSVLPTGASGGDLGFIPMDPAQWQEWKKSDKFWNAVYSTEKGHISAAFKNDDGKWYIVKIEDVKPASTLPFTGEFTARDGTKMKVEEHAKAILRLQRRNAEIERRVKDFKARAKVEVKEDLVK